jgi:serine phosphatase RsbU (regulator of sigma subunit)
MDQVVTEGVIEWAHASRPLSGYSVSGDLHLAIPFAGGALIAVADGLGHGQEAATASRIAADILSSEPGAAPVTLVERCHEALRGTRGTALLVVSLSWATRTYSWVGVGNVEGVRYRPGTDAKVGREPLISVAGVVGYQIRPLRERDAVLEPGDLFVLASDGISPRFIESVVIGWELEDLARTIMTRYARANDDALVLVARYKGRP